jgi:hypothetical protein
MSEVTIADVNQSNGVIHVVDAVLQNNNIDKRLVLLIERSILRDFINKTPILIWGFIMYLYTYLRLALVPFQSSFPHDFINLGIS